MVVIIAQIVGLLAIVSFAISPHQKTKIKVLIFQLFSSILYAFQYFLLGAFSAVAINIIELFKNLIFSKYAKDNEKIPFYWLAIYIIISLIACIFTYENIISIFPIMLSILFTYYIWKGNFKLFRIVAVIGAFFWIAYNLYVSAYINAIGNIGQLISVLIAIWRFDIPKK